MSFNYPQSKSVSCVETYYRFDCPILRDGAYLKFKVDYKKGDGSIGTQNFSGIYLDKIGIRQDNSANWYIGHEMVRIYDIQFFDPQKDKKNAGNNVEQTANNVPKTPPAKNNTQVGNTNNNATPAYTYSTQPKATPKTNTTSYQQQFQQWQNNNSQTQQTINNSFDNLKNQIQQAYEQKQAAADEKYEREKKEREDKWQQQQQESDARIQQQQQEAREESIRSNQYVDAFVKESNLALEISGDYFYYKPSRADVNNPTATSIYYVALFRDGNIVWLMKPMKVDKYSDDSWLAEEKLKAMIAPLFPNTSKKLTDYRYADLLRIMGYFTNEKDAFVQYNSMLQNSNRHGCTVNVIEPTVKKNTTTPAKDFWNN